MDYDYTSPSWTTMESHNSLIRNSERSEVLRTLTNLLDQAALDSRSDEYQSALTDAIDAVRSRFAASTLR